MSSDAFPIEETTMLEPPALKRLIGPRALLPLALAVAAIFYLMTAGWSPIGNGVEGEIAGCARRMFETGTWTVEGKAPGSLPLCWLGKISFRLLGVSEFSARAPFAFAVLVIVLFVFLLAERVGGSWRGFVGSMILVGSPGMFTFGRAISAGPVFAALMTGAFYCAYRGFEMRNTRRGWLAAFWLCIVAACAVAGWRALLYPALVIALMSACYREARMRFKALLSPEGALAVVAVVASEWMRGGGAWQDAPMPASRFVLLQPAAIFPWSLLLLAPAFAALNRLRQWRPIEFYQAFPLAWMTISFVISVLTPHRQPFDSLLVWVGFAVWASVVIDVIPRRSFLAALAGVILSTVVAWFISQRVRGFFTSEALPCAAFLFLTAMGSGMEWRNRRKLTLLALFAGTMFLGGALIDRSAKSSDRSSLAGISRFLNSKAQPDSAIYFAGARTECSSLGFYLESPYRVVEPQVESVDAVLQQAGKVYVIDKRSLTAGRTPIFQSGHYAVLTNGG